jgi:hypothetical protein
MLPPNRMVFFDLEDEPAISPYTKVQKRREVLEEVNQSDGYLPVPYSPEWNNHEAATINTNYVEVS